jgi:hypothetical protein
VIWRVFRAIWPSSQSLKEAARKIAVAIMLLIREEEMRKTTRRGTKKILPRVNLFGRFRAVSFFMIGELHEDQEAQLCQIRAIISSPPEASKVTQIPKKASPFE